MLNICSASWLQAVPMNDHFLLAPVQDVNRSECSKTPCNIVTAPEATQRKKPGRMPGIYTTVTI